MNLSKILCCLCCLLSVHITLGKTKNILFIGYNKVGTTSVKNKFANIKEIDKEHNQRLLYYANGDNLGLNYISEYNKDLEDNYKKRHPNLTISGQQFFCTNYAKDYDIIVFVYDITNKTSFKKIDEYYNYFLISLKGKKYTGHLLLVGNKCDMPSTREVTTEVAKKYAEEKGMIFLEVSTITGEGINKLRQLVKNINKKSCWEKNGCKCVAKDGSKSYFYESK